MQKEERRKHLLKIQLISGCDNIVCKNVNCRRCKNFLYKDKDIDELKEIAKSITKGKSKSVKICDSISRIDFDDDFLETQKELETFAKSDFNDDNKLKYFKKQIKCLFSNPNIFANFLASNDHPYSINNSKIDDDFFFEMSSKLSNSVDLENDMLSGLYMIAQNVINDKKFFDFYTNMRCFMILFYFPVLISPDINPPILFPLFKRFSQMNSEQQKVFEKWASKLPNLRKQMIGFIHNAISIYYSNHNNPSPHSESLHILIKAMKFLHLADYNSSNPLPPSAFYDDHINESVNVETELDLFSNRNLHGKNASLLKKSPFILTLKTKANICKHQSIQLMTFMGQHSMALSNQDQYTTEKYLTIRVRRKNLVADAVEQLSHQNSNSFLKKLRVVFQGEKAVDVGGPSREFLYLVSESLFSPEYGMFSIVNNKYNWFSYCSYESERSFFLCGAVLGLAIHNSIVLPIRFPCVLYKRLLTPDRELIINDLSQIDPDASSSLRNLIEMKENGIDVSEAYLTFSYLLPHFDTHKEVALDDKIPPDTEVTNENLEQYISCYLNYLLKKGIQKPFNAFKKGFDTTCKVPAYKLFEPEEMDIIVSGVEILDWGALKRATIYEGYKEDSRQIRWFWEIFDKKFTKEEKLKFLKFSVGTDRAPVGGLGSLKLIIQRIKDINKLPTAHTCFNKFCLPAYKKKDILESKVKLAIQYTEGFGIR